MAEGQELPPLRKPHQHPGKVTAHMKRGYTQEAARALTARDLMLEKNKEKVVTLKNLANYDSLTGLPNKRFLMGDPNASPPIKGELEDQFALAKKYGTSITMLVLDCDGFKAVNEQGHPMGDAILQQLGKVVKEGVRPSDIVARFGGDEFCVLMPETHKLTQEEFTSLVDRLRTRVRGTEFKNGNKLTVSIGVATYPNGTMIENPEELFERADSALFEAKKRGKDQAMMFTGEVKGPSQFSKVEVSPKG